MFNFLPITPSLFPRNRQRLHSNSPQPGAVLLALPRNKAELDEAVKRAKAIVTRRAALASAATLIPLPGLDIAVDISAVMKLIPAINNEFGLTPAQIEKLSPGRQLTAYKSIIAVGSLMIGKLITRDIAIGVLRTLGIRVAAKQLGKYVPVAGQALSIALGFAAMKYIGHQHIADCRRVIEITLKA